MVQLPRMGSIVRLSELYNSVQGEGPRVGLPTTFVRFGGCNLRCPGWPCDSPYAIFPKEYRSEWKEVNAEKLAADIVEMTYPGSNICLTGGEPWLQNHEELAELIALLSIANRKVECFSNGTIEIPNWAFDLVSFVFDRKLASSGENLDKIRSFGGINGADVFFTNLHRAFEAGRASLKYTVTSLEDISEAIEDHEKLCNPYISPEDIREKLPVYVGAVWGKIREEDIADWLSRTDLVHWRLNVQVHKHIFDPEARGI